MSNQPIYQIQFRMDPQQKLPIGAQTHRESQSMAYQYSSVPNTQQECKGQHSDIEYMNRAHINIKSGSIAQQLYWVTLVLLLLTLAYFLFDNHSQEREIKSIMRQIQKQELAMGELEKVDKSQRDNQRSQQQIKQGKNNQQKKIWFPRQAWYFSRKPINQSSLWTQKCFEAYQIQIIKLGFDFKIVNLSNYFQFIPKERHEIIEQSLKNIKQRYQSGQQPQIVKYGDSIAKQIIMLQIVCLNGGVYLDQDIILTEDLTWINQINQNKYVNAKQWIDKIQILAFYSPFLSLDMAKSKFIQADLETEKYIVEIPTISSYFLVAINESIFLKDLRDQYYQLLFTNSKALRQKLQRYELQVNFSQKPIHLYKYLFQISSQIVLHKKQKANGPQNPVIKHYQLAAINENYGAKKMKVSLQQNQPNKVIKHLTRMTKEQLEYEFGRIRYMIRLQPQAQYYDLLIEEIQNKKIVRGSFIHKFLFSSKNISFIQNIQRQQGRNQTWDSLPAKLWTYSKGDDNSLLMKIWRKYNHFISIESRFKFMILTQQNLHEYISRQNIKRIETAISNKDNKLRISDNTKMEMISLAVLYEQGGVWIDPEVFLIGHLQWLKNINQQPSIWNKKGPTPKVLLAFNPHYISQFEWKYTPEGIKQSWLLGYQKDFIAAQPKAQLIKIWLSQYILNLQINFQQLKNKFYQCKVGVSDMWINQKDHSFLAQDSLKCILGSKKTQFIHAQNSQSPAQYYGLWAINAFSGLLKMRENTDYLSSSRSMQNPFIWRKSFDQMQEIVGKIHYFSRIYYPSSSKIEQLCKSNANKLQLQLHKDSFFMKLLEKLNDKVVINDGKPQLSKQLSLLKKIKEN